MFSEAVSFWLLILNLRQVIKVIGLFLSNSCDPLPLSMMAIIPGPLNSSTQSVNESLSRRVAQNTRNRHGEWRCLSEFFQWQRCIGNPRGRKDGNLESSNGKPLGNIKTSDLFGFILVACFDILNAKVLRKVQKNNGLDRDGNRWIHHQGPWVDYGGLRTCRVAGKHNMLGC